MKIKKILIYIVIVCVLLFVGCENDELYVDEDKYNSENIYENNEISEEKYTNYQYIKYRDEMVDLAHNRWEYLDTSKSSWINGAWYDSVEDYMIIDLSGTKYQYCGLQDNIWNRFKNASSFGTDYNSYIKGSYDCRVNNVPEY